nr:immunoglobulin heavy chain junction region [Macaca mulatta]MOV53400.1 immunoglobulin heavy chain junction region [Macaca mulatta]MOV53697.1 immunoglobulin heavy chain junction region [Macaca mulatta]MOV53709.1 immunoglobulin heavy chain junction region [Macaca mulatta]MOV53738.1 immunoglobulin heavy chain junction region [Macaca mulatta]
CTTLGWNKDRFDVW